MKMHLVIFAGAMLLCASLETSAQQSKNQAPNQACWEMSVPIKELNPFVLILLNKCSIHHH